MSRTRSGAGRRADPYEILFGPWSVGVALAIVAGAIAGAWFVDPGGVDLELCWLRAISGLPCPGCGLTRSVWQLARGDAVQAIGLHPFGLLVLPFSALAASSLLWPANLRARVRSTLDLHRAGVDSVYRATVLLFVTYGALRAVAAAILGWPGRG